ncbi:MAG: hypothetical protein O2943_08100 [Actinomycetota bacterium]|nr:hypothetical protein [Actinomycetota bacterium]
MFGNRRFVAIGATALLGAAALAGCSSSSEPAASSTLGTAQLPAPVMIAPDQTEASVKVGNFIVFNVESLAGTTISTDKPELLELSQAKEEGGAEFNPGAKALGVGVAIVTVTNPDSSTRDVTVTIT